MTRLLDAVTGHRLDGDRFGDICGRGSPVLERLVAERPRRQPLCLALIGLDGVEDLAVRGGRRWAEQQVERAARALGRIETHDPRLTGYRAGALTLGLVMAGITLEEAFDVAVVAWRAVTGDTDGLCATIGLAELDGGHAIDALTLEIAADAALDQARSLGQPESGSVVAAAPAGSGLRWLSSRSATTVSAAL